MKKSTLLLFSILWMSAYAEAQIRKGSFLLGGGVGFSVARSPSSLGGQKQKGLNISRHSDHHFMASRKYQVLRHHDHSPQMPTGYPGMMLLAAIPPIWFRVMNKRVKKLQV